MRREIIVLYAWSQKPGATPKIIAWFHYKRPKVEELLKYLNIDSKNYDEVIKLMRFIDGEDSVYKYKDIYYKFDTFIEGFPNSPYAEPIKSDFE